MSSKFRYTGHCAVAMAALLLAGASAHAELAVSANDGKQLRPGDTINYVEPDSVTVLDIAGNGVKRLGTVAAPACMIGSPTAVAVSKDSRFAIVTACQKMEGGKLVPNDTASVIDLSNPRNPRVIQTLQTGYELFGRVVRPAMVIVAAKGSGGEAQAEPAAQNPYYAGAGETPGDPAGAAVDRRA